MSFAYGSPVGVESSSSVNQLVIRSYGARPMSFICKWASSASARLSSFHRANLTVIDFFSRNQTLNPDHRNIFNKVLFSENHIFFYYDNMQIYANLCQWSGSHRPVQINLFRPGALCVNWIELKADWMRLTGWNDLKWRKISSDDWCKWRQWPAAEYWNSRKKGLDLNRFEIHQPRCQQPTASNKVLFLDMQIQVRQSRSMQICGCGRQRRVLIHSFGANEPTPQRSYQSSCDR